jgi:hypothetical protein
MLVHGIPFLLYCPYLVYNMNYHSEGGTALVWFLLLVLALGIHLLVVVIQLLYLIFQSWKKGN